MAKQRKTRKEKIHSDTRIQKKVTPSAVSFQQHTVQLPLSEKTIQHTVPTTTHSQYTATVSADYHYLKTDLLKTLILMIGVVVVEFLMKIGMK
jgi:hypothetical protein